MIPDKSEKTTNQFYFSQVPHHSPEGGGGGRRRMGRGMEGVEWEQKPKIKEDCKNLGIVFLHNDPVGPSLTNFSFQ